MKEKFNEKLYGMKDVPDILIFCPLTDEHLTMGNLQYFTHKLNGSFSEIRIVESLMNSDTIHLLSNMVDGGCLIYSVFKIRSKATGKDKYLIYFMNDAKLINYQFGTAADGEPSNYTYSFVGDLIEEISDKDLSEHIFNLLKEDTGYQYN